MALQIKTVTAQGFTCPEAYVVIERTSYRKGNGQLMGTAYIYKDKASRDAGLAAFKQQRVRTTYDVKGAEMIAQLYTELKTDPSMENALDV